MDAVVNQLVSLMTTVSVLVIISIGLAVVFGMMGVINLAHGEFLMLGAFFTLSGHRLDSTYGSPWWWQPLVLDSWG